MIKKGSLYIALLLGIILSLLGLAGISDSDTLGILFLFVGVSIIIFSILILYRMGTKDNESVKKESIFTISNPDKKINDDLKPKSSENTPSSTKNKRLIEAKIFISYRREDTSYITGRIYDKLQTHFQKENLFKDVDSIPLGVDFREHISNMIEESNIVLVIIGSKWLDVDKAVGHPRIHNKRDFVRIEIESALSKGVPIIPILTENVRIPSEDMLPPSIKDLAYRNGIVLRPDPDFHHDTERLMESIDRHME